MKKKERDRRTQRQRQREKNVEGKWPGRSWLSKAYYCNIIINNSVIVATA